MDRHIGRQTDRQNRSDDSVDIDSDDVGESQNDHCHDGNIVVDEYVLPVFDKEEEQQQQQQQQQQQEPR